MPLGVLNDFTKYYGLDTYPVIQFTFDMINNIKTRLIQIFFISLIFFNSVSAGPAPIRYAASPVYKQIISPSGVVLRAASALPTGVPRGNNALAGTTSSYGTALTEGSVRGASVAPTGVPREKDTDGTTSSYGTALTEGSVRGASVPPTGVPREKDTDGTTSSYGTALTEGSVRGASVPPTGIDRTADTGIAKSPVSRGLADPINPTDTQSRISSLMAELSEAKESAEQLTEQIKTDIATFTTTVKENFSSDDAQTILESSSPVIADEVSPVEAPVEVPVTVDEVSAPAPDETPVTTPTVVAHSPVDRAISGNLGVGIKEPQARLDVNGTARFNGDLRLETGNLDIRSGSIKISDGTQGSGKILSSREDGTATWIDPIELRLARLTENNTLNLGENAQIISSGNLNLDAAKVNMNGILSLKPALTVPTNPESGDIYFNASGALCLFLVVPGDDPTYGYWEQIAGLREASCEADNSIEDNSAEDDNVIY